MDRKGYDKGKTAGQKQKRGLNALFSLASVSRVQRGTALGQAWDKRDKAQMALPSTIRQTPSGFDSLSSSGSAESGKFW